MSGDGLTDEGRERLRELARSRPYTCPKCGGHKVTVPGSELTPDGHWPTLEYEVCYGCGWEQPKRTRKKKPRLNRSGDRT